MIAMNPELPRVVLYEGRDSQRIGKEVRDRVVGLLLDRGYTVSRVTDRGALGDLGHPQWIVLGIFDGQLPDTSSATGSLHVRDIRDDSPETILSFVQGITSEPQEGKSDASAASAGKARWKPWFPVIDYDRCTNCMQCLSFCLFDVYGVTKGGKITVQNQSNCKTDCPACSRVCPEVAILFPKYKAGPINGDEINQDDLRREAMKVDISALLGGDIYSMLRDRSVKAKSRFSKERDDDRALKERQRCMDKLKSN